MRLHGLVLALVLGAGCSSPDTQVRLTVRLGKAPAPAQLSVSIYAAGKLLAPPSTIKPVTLPGTIVLDAIDPTLPALCVALDGLASDGTVTSRGAASIAVLPRMTADAAVELDAGGDVLDCANPVDGGARDLSGGSVADLAGADLPSGVVAVCPAGAVFCDDFESGDTSKWGEIDTRFDLGAEINVQSQIVRHGKYALHAAATGHDMDGAGESIVVATLPAMMPPIAVRANVYAVESMARYTVSVELYDDSVHGFSISADNDDLWTLTQDQATDGTPDQEADMVTFSTGAWHCIELVVDAVGNASVFVDEHQLIGPYPRAAAVAYTTLQLGLGRTINPVNNVYVDDVAVGPSRLYCP